MLTKKCKILVTIVLSLALALCISIPCISYCSADYSDDIDYALNLSCMVDTTEDSFYNSIYSSRYANPAFGNSLIVTQGSMTTNILYQYDYYLNNIITFTSSNYGINGIHLVFSDFVYDFNDSTSIFGSIYIEGALYVAPSVFIYDINSGNFVYETLDNLFSTDGWYALDFAFSNNYINDAGYSYIQFLVIDIRFNTTNLSRTIELNILPNYSYGFADFFNSLKTVERIEYELNFFDSLAQVVDRVMLIEIFPGISFYSLLSVVIAVPIFIAILKLWLGG